MLNLIIRTDKRQSLQIRCKDGLTREITHVHVEGVCHAHADQNLLQFISLAQREPGQRHVNLTSDEHVRTSPLHKVLIGEGVFQLGMPEGLSYMLLTLLPPFLFPQFSCSTLTMSHLLQACGLVLNIHWQHDNHAEVLPFIRELQDLYTCRGGGFERETKVFKLQLCTRVPASEDESTCC